MKKRQETKRRKKGKKEKLNKAQTSKGNDKKRKVFRGVRDVKRRG